MSRDAPERPAPPSWRATLDGLRGTAWQAVVNAGATVTAWEARGSSILPLAPLAWRPLRSVNQRRIRQRCRVAQAEDGVALCRVLGRFKFYVDAADHGLAVHLMLDGYWEMHVTQVVAALVRPGMVAVDVGANQGYYTVLMADLVGPGGHVHAVEPNARMMSLLRRSVLANGFGSRVALHAAPIGPEGDELVLRVPEGSPSGAFMEAAPGDPAAQRAVTLDAVLAGSDADFIKIDAEGAEMAAWAGMAGTLARSRSLTILMEFVLDRAREPAAFLADVARQGFELFHVHRGRGVQPVTAERILASPGGQEWMLLLRR